MAHVLQLGFGKDDAALLGGAEDLLKVESLPLVGDVEHLVRLPVLHTLDHGRQVGGGIDGRAVALDENTGRNFFLVLFLGNGDDPGAVGEDCVTLFLHIGDHSRDVGIRIAFTQPLFIVDIQHIVDPVQVRQGNTHHVIPDGTVAGTALLQLIGGNVGLFGKHGVCLFGRCGGVDLLQFRKSEGRLLRVRAGVAGIEIAKLRLTELKLRDDKAHLQTPVTHMDVTDGVVAEEFVKPLQGLADDGRPQVTDVQRLCHISSTVVYHDGLAIS